MNWSEFFTMGGYGLYVWGSYLFAFIVLLLNIIAPIYHRKRLIRSLRQFITANKVKRNET